MLSSAHFLCSHISSYYLESTNCFIKCNLFTIIKANRAAISEAIFLQYVLHLCVGFIGVHTERPHAAYL